MIWHRQVLQESYNPLLGRVVVWLVLHCLLVVLDMFR